LTRLNRSAASTSFGFSVHSPAVATCGFRECSSNWEVGLRLAPEGGEALLRKDGSDRHRIVLTAVNSLPAPLRFNGAPSGLV